MRLCLQPQWGRPPEAEETLPPRGAADPRGIWAPSSRTHTYPSIRSANIHPASTTSPARGQAVAGLRQETTRRNPCPHGAQVHTEGD